MGLGDACAQAWMAAITNDNIERFRWAQKSAAQGERDGFYELGCCYQVGTGCDQDKEKAKENFLIAAKFGYVSAMDQLSDMLDTSDPQRFYWKGKAASTSKKAYIQESFNTAIAIQLQTFGIKQTNVVFVIGRALKGHIKNNKRKFFGFYTTIDLDELVLFNHAVQFYNFQLQSYRNAVDCWTLVGLRNNVVKDIRKLIGKMIWDSREDAKYFEMK